METNVVLTDEILKKFVGGIVRMMYHLEVEIYQGKVKSLQLSDKGEVLELVFEWCGRLASTGIWEPCSYGPLNLAVAEYGTTQGGENILYLSSRSKSYFFFRPGVHHFDLKKVVKIQTFGTIPRR